MTAASTNPLGKRIGLLTSLLGCWHKRLSRPFHDGQNAYRVCTECGARRRFNTATFKTEGSYYAPEMKNRTDRG